MDMTEAKYVDTSTQVHLHKVPLTILNENDSETIFNVIILGEDKEKTKENVAKVRFFIDSVLGLKDRLALGPINDPIIGIDIKVGEIMSVTKHPNADSLMICNVNLGKRAITVVTNDLNVKEGNSVGVSLLPPQSFMETTSEGMFLGMDGNILKEVEGELGEMPKGIPMDSLNETRNLVEAFLK